jgi:hypothetical protein
MTTPRSQADQHIIVHRPLVRGSRVAILSTPTTRFDLLDLAEQVFRGRLHVGSATPFSALNTIWAVSPAKSGTRSSSKSNASCDSAPGSEKPVE